MLLHPPCPVLLCAPQHHGLSGAFANVHRLLGVVPHEARRVGAVLMKAHVVVARAASWLDYPTPSVAGRLTSAFSAFCFSMISAQSVTHSSQIIECGPATSAVTSVEALPQKEQKWS